MRAGKLREDLYYRVNVVSVELPPLRQRTADIADLVHHFINKHAGGNDRASIGESALQTLQRYTWPGNVRELENMVERALILSGGGVLAEEHFLLDWQSPKQTPSGSPHPVSSDDPSGEAARPLNPAVEALEAELIDRALSQASGNKARAAALLDISERSLWYKLKKYRPEQGADS